MWTLNSIEIPTLKNLDEERIQEIREEIADVLGLADFEVVMFAYDENNEEFEN